MQLSNSIKKRFIKDNNLPINVIQEPYFIENLETLNKEFDTFKLLDNLYTILRELKTEENFFNEAERIVKSTQEKSKLTEGYNFLSTNKSLVNETNYIQSIKGKYKLNKNLYTEINLNKYFISIDLKQANFHALKYFKAIPEEFKTYQDMLKSETSFDYFINSKQIRQVIFGGLLPKKFKNISEFVMLNILDNLPNILKDREGIILNTDEIIIPISIDMFSIYFTELEKIIKKDDNNDYYFELDSYRFPLKVNTFELLPIKDKKEKLYFIKDYNGKKELKTVPSLFYMQFYKKINKLPITDNDLTFYYEGMIAKFKESVFDE